MSSPKTARLAIDVVKEAWKGISALSGMDRTLVSFEGMKILSANHQGEIKLKIPVQNQQLNWSGNVHGGYMAYLVDVAGSLAISARTGDVFSGVSTDLSVSYLNGANNQEDLIVHSVCEKAGKTLAFTNVSIHQGEKLIANGRHTKFIGNRHKSKL